MCFYQPYNLEYIKKEKWLWIETQAVILMRLVLPTGNMTLACEI